MKAPVRVRQSGRRRSLALPLTAGALVAVAAGVVGWLASQPPLPEPLPYEVAVPAAPEAPEAEATEAAEPAEAAEAETEGGISLVALAEPVETPAPPPSGEAGVLSAAETGRRAMIGGRATTIQPTPHPALIEQGRYGLVPVVAADGRQSWQIYARPYDDDDPRPQLAVVIAGLGLSSAVTNQAVQMPGEVTLAFSPYAADAESFVRQARAAGHEVLLELPMEPVRFPQDDPGPRALLTSLGANQNIDRLNWVLARFAGYVGVIETQGARFTASEVHLEPVMGEIKRRGLLYVERRFGDSPHPREIASRIGLIRIGTDIDLDIEPSRREITKRLAAAEMLARRDGTAVLVARPLPVTFELLKAWIMGLEDNLDWEKHDKAYFDSDARKAMQPDPGLIIARMENHFIEEV